MMLSIVKGTGTKAFPSSLSKVLPSAKPFDCCALPSFTGVYCFSMARLVPSFSLMICLLFFC